MSDDADTIRDMLRAVREMAELDQIVMFSLLTAHMLQRGVTRETLLQAINDGADRIYNKPTRE